MRLALVVVGTLIGAWQTSAAAQPQPQPSAPTPAPAAVTNSAPVEVLPLSLGEAIALGIENNTDVQIVRYDPPIAEYDHDAAWGVHDPELFNDFLYERRNTPVASFIIGLGTLTEEDVADNAGFRGLVPRIGWTYSIGYFGNQLDTNSAPQALSTEYRSGLTANLTAPLMRGAWWGAAWTQVELTGIGSDLALEQFRQNLMDIVAGIETGYWNLAATKQALGVSNKSLETSRALLGQTQAQYEVGVVSRVEVTEAEAGVADREFRQITSENLYRAAQDDLIDLVYGPRLTPTSQLEIEPTDRPEDYVTFALDPETSAERALTRRPELMIARQQVEQAEILVKFAKNERLPQLDVVGGYGVQGLSGDPNPDGFFGGPPLAPGVVPRDYADSDNSWWHDDNRSWSAGALFSIPLPNTSARANVSKSELQLRKALTNVKRTEQDIVKDVRDAVRNLASALEGVQAAERAVAASAEQLRAEKIRLEHGESTPFDVLLREENLVTAESQRIAALRVYHGSVTALDRAQGTLLEDRSIVLEDALPLR